MSKAPVSVKPTIAPPKNWRWSPIQAVARLESGHTPSRRHPEYWGGDIPWLSLKDIQELRGAYVYETADMPTALGIENSSARVLPKGTVALCRTASVGKVAILGRDMATSQDFVDWVCGAELHPEYLFWALRASSATFELEKQGSTHKTIYMPVLERLQVLLPPVDEQRRIAAILDKADAIRRKRQEALALTEQLLRSTFLEMFGDPAINPMKRPYTFLGELIAETQYGTGEKANSEQRGLPVLRMNNLTYQGRFDLRDLKWCDICPADLEKYTVRYGDILFNRTNSPELVGKTGVWVLDEQYAYAGYLIRIRLDSAKATAHYVSALLNSTFGKKQLFDMAKASSNMSNISASDLRRIRLPLAPLAEQQRFDAVVDATLRGERVRNEALEAADTLFESLTHRAFTGQL